ncbi:iron-containing alcohol dehydrogenase [Spirillospora sp. NPDC046719]
MTPIWGLTEGGNKRAAGRPRVPPRGVVYGPDLSFRLSVSVAASSGTNVMAHCVEALYAPDADPISSLLAKEGLRLLAAGLPTSVAATSTRTAHADVLLGACLAGWAPAAAGTALHHKICHILGRLVRFRW